MFSPELRKGSIELLILSLLEVESRHGYDLGKLIELRSRGRLQFQVSSLYPVLFRMEDRGGSRDAGWRRRISGEGSTTGSPGKEGRP